MPATYALSQNAPFRHHPQRPGAPWRWPKIIREAVGRQTEPGHAAQAWPCHTQSSVSRDLRELGVAKLGDRYVLPETAAPTRNDFSSLRQFVSARLTAGTNLTVLKTTVGSAQSVAVAIDTARWPEVIGTISGDDTIFIATAGARGAQAG